MPNESYFTDFSVQFTVDKRQLSFSNDKSVTHMTFDEIKLIKEIGSVVINGLSFLVGDISVDIAENASGCRYMVIINLTKNY